MLNFGPEKLFLVGVIALIVLGPHRLPQAARTAGRVVAQLRRMSASFQQEVREAISEPTDALTSTVTEFRVPDIRRSMKEAITSTFSAPVTAVPVSGATGAPAVPTRPTATGSDLVPPAPDDPSLN